MVERDWESTDWAQGDTLTATELSNHSAEGHAEGEIFFEIDSGDPVIKDTTSDTIILRWDRANSNWKLENADFDFNSRDLTNVGAADVNEYQINGRILRQADAIGPGATGGAVNDIDSTSSTSFVTVSNAVGFVDQSRVPPGATLYGRTFARMDNDTDGESATVAPFVSGTGVLDSISVTKTSTSNSVDLSNVDSGWQEVTESGVDGPVNAIQAKVSGGSVSFSNNQVFFAFEWRVD